MKQISLFMLLAAAVFASCKKDKGFHYSGCRVREVKKLEHGLPNSASNYTFTYNEEGKVQQIAIAGTVNTFEYSATRVFKYATNAMLILNISDNQIMSTDSLELDANGRVSKIFNKSSNGHLDPIWKEYTYDNEGQMTILKYWSSGKVVSIDSAFWENGKMVIYQHNTPAAGYAAYDKYTYSYYDTVYNMGINNASVEDLVDYGRGIFRVNKLEKSKFAFVHMYTVYSRGYKLDTDGKILEIMEDGPWAGITWEIKYDCR